ncbi:MAG: hypothetical protein RPR40_00080 [Bermanella sp.]
MLRWGMMMLFMPSVLLVSFYMMEAQDVARCLNESGSWDYVLALCDMATQHESSTFMQRHGLWVNLGMLVSLLGLAMGTWGMILKGMSTPKDEG